MLPAALRRTLPDRPRVGWRRFLRVSTHKVFWTLVDRFSANNLLTSASAIAFQVLIAVVSLVLLGLALIDLLSLQERVWAADVAPFLKDRFTPETFAAIKATVEKIFANGTLGLLAFAAVLALWEVSGAVRAISGALNAIYKQKEDRSTWRRFGTSFWLAAAVIVCLVGAVFAVSLTPRIPVLPHLLSALVGWACAFVLLSVAVWLLLRYAPCRCRPAGWTSVGSIMIVAGWATATVLFGYYAKNIADYRSVVGNLAALLTLTAYLYTSSIIFLTGTQVDELLRKQSNRGYKGLDALTHLPGRNGASPDSDSDKPSRRATRQPRTTSRSR